MLALAEGLHPVRGEGRGASKVHPAPAPDAAVDKVVGACASIPKRTRGLVWHTQGSGKTFTMIKAAELLFKANEAEKPTILLMIDRNELEDQMLKNLAALGMANVAHADSIAALNKLLTEDRLPRHRRHDDPQVPRHAGEPQHAQEHLRPDRRSPPHDRRRPGQLPDGRPAERRLHRLHRHAGGQDRIRQGNVQDLRLRGRQGLSAQVLDRGEHRGRHDAAALLQPRAQRDARAARDHGKGVLALAETEGSPTSRS